MARIYAGELTKVEKEVVERLREELPDDFTVLAEVNVGRNVDLVVIRPNGDAPAVFIGAELKHVSRPLLGQTDGAWKEMTDDGDWKVIEPSNDNDLNYYWQAVHAADALQRWLWLNQRIFRDDASALDGNRFNVWPDLVLLSDRPIAHRLQTAPANRYGKWYFGFDEWLRHLLEWNPRKGVPLHQREVDRLVEAMGLVELPGLETRLLPADEAPQDELASVVRDLKERVLVLESMLEGPMRPVMPIGRPEYALTARAS
jgi:hypothetical protein